MSRAVREDAGYGTLEIDAVDGYTYTIGASESPVEERDPGGRSGSGFYVAKISRVRATVPAMTDNPTERAKDKPEGYWTATRADVEKAIDHAVAGGKEEALVCQLLLDSIGDMDERRKTVG